MVGKKGQNIRNSLSVLAIAQILAATVLLPGPARLGSAAEVKRYQQTSLWIINSTGKRVKILCQIADTPDKRSQGLMYRRRLEPGKGMLFVFEQERKVAFWMKNTYIPLSIAFISQQKRIVAIDTMEPLTLELHSSQSPVKFALEVDQGFFRQHNISVGDRVEMPKL